MAIQHNNIPDADRHEAKGASTASLGTVLRANGNGTTSFVTPSSLNNVNIASIIEGVSFVTQGPTAVDTPYQVTWGSANSNADVGIAANGTVTILNSGLYFVTFNLNLGRSNATGIATVAARLLINDAPTGFVQAVKIDTSANVTPLSISSLRSFSGNTTIKVQIIRDSSGANDGGLITVDPVLTGWDNSPSAAIRIQKIGGGF